MDRFENGGDMSGFRSLNNSTSKRVLNLLEPVKLTVWEVMIERVTSCCLSPIRRNSFLEELRVRRLAVIQEEICCRAFCK